ncbi:MAG: FeoA family protein [Candidatus Syntropharchaeales archaeon]|nr:ferrous iron transport protein A [Candidatus Syntrophoarchaeum sp.]
MKREITLAEIQTGEVKRVKAVLGGRGIQNNIRSMGIREGKVLRVVTRQPMRGPIIVEIDGMRIAIGRGMAKKILLGDL